MRPERLDPAALLEAGPRGVAGAVLLAPLRLGGRTLPKGTRLDAALARELHGAVASGDHAEAVRVAWAEPGDLHEDEAARRLAEAATGPGVRIGALRQSRIDLTASVDGVLRVNVAGLSAVNRIDPLEVFTLFHGQSVRAGQTVASVKVAPHLVPESAVSTGEQLARAAAPLLEVRPYLPLTVAALSLEPLTPDARQRFESAARTKVTSLGGRFSGLTQVSDTDSGPASAPCTAALRRLALEDHVAVLLVGGVSAGDPLSPLYHSLEELGGKMLRRGVPAHPGSMIWLALLEQTTLLGLPQCGMFSMATAADLVLPRLLTGEPMTADTLADLGHGGLLGPEMRFRFPDYARDLETPG